MNPQESTSREDLPSGGRATGATIGPSFRLKPMSFSSLQISILMTTVQDPQRNILILRAPASSGGLGGVFQPAWGTSSMVQDVVRIE